MHRVYIASSTIPSQTANSVHVMKMCRALATTVKKVTLVIPQHRGLVSNGRDPDYANEYEYYGVQSTFTTRRIRKGSLPGSGHLFGLRAGLLARNIAADLVYGRHVSGCFFSALLRLPTAYESHQPIQDAGRYSTLLFRIMLKLRRFRFLVVITNSLRRFYVDNFRVDYTSILVSPDAADPLPPLPASSSPSKSTRRMQVGFIGQLYPGKGIAVIERVAPTMS